jgi:hypothetical protein
MSIPSSSLEDLKKKLNTWRKTRTSKEKLPEEIWQEAIANCKFRGVGAVAKAAGLDFYQLRDRVRRHELSRTQKLPESVSPPRTETITVSKIVPPTDREQLPLLEFENAHGVKLRVEANSDFATKLLGAFFSSVR